MEKVVTQQVKYDNPELVTNINRLKQENQNLQSQLTGLTSKYSNGVFIEGATPEMIGQACRTAWEPTVNEWKNLANQCIDAYTSSLGTRFQYTPPSSPSNCFWNSWDGGGTLRCY